VSRDIDEERWLNYRGIVSACQPVPPVLTIDFGQEIVRDEGNRWDDMIKASVMVPFPADAASSRDLHAEVWANYVNAVAASVPRDPFKAYPVPFLGQTSPDPVAPIPYGFNSHLDACGLSANDVAVVTGLLLTVFNDDHAAAKKWLGERCGPLWGKPIDVLKEGGVERVLAFLRQAAP
jgi:hypothetical protein